MTDPLISLNCSKMSKVDYGRDLFVSDEEKSEYDKRVEEEIEEFTTAWLDAGECAQPIKAWMEIRERLYLQTVAKRPKTVKVRNIMET